MPRNRNPNAHLTAKERGRPSYPTRRLLAMRRIEGRVLDFGCGYGADVDFLRDKGFDVTGYDPHHAPAYPEGTFDTILCHYVLNVLFPKEQSRVLYAGGGATSALRASLLYGAARCASAGISHAQEAPSANVSVQRDSAVR